MSVHIGTSLAALFAFERRFKRDGGDDPRDARALDRLAALADVCRDVVDAKLAAPARWRGAMRRDLHGHGSAAERDRYAGAYDELVAFASRRPDELALNEDVIRYVHDLAVGGSQYRSTTIWAGPPVHVFPPPGEVAGLMDAFVRSSASRREHPVIAAARAHLALLTIHPFADGNGRTARLVSTMILVRSGYRSTLLVGAEQYFWLRPDAYVECLDDYRFGRIDEDECIGRLIVALIENVYLAAWFRVREHALREKLRDGGLPARRIAEALVRFDVRGERVHRALQDMRPFVELREQLGAARQHRLSFQLGRLLDEERD